MSEEDQSSKTEQPTEKKLRDARKKGDVPASKEVSATVGTGALLIGLALLFPGMAPDLAGQMGNLVQLAPQIDIGTGSAGAADAGLVLRDMFWQILLTVAPFFAVMVGTAIAGVLIQGQTVVAVERIKPKVSNISPASGLKKIFSGSALFDFVKNVLKVLVVICLAAWVGVSVMYEILPGGTIIPEKLPAFLSMRVSAIFIAAVCFLIPVTAIDVVHKRYTWMQKQRMSQKEIKDEFKDSEGSPEIKQKRMQLRMRRAAQSLKTSVPTADLILTNPTHYAVALRYRQGVDTAPVCVAKGVDLVAANIRSIAREHDIPIIENRPLARALYGTIEVDQMIPGEHWESVAQIVGYVMDLRRKIRRQPPRGSTLRIED